jgi:tetratricopeptide (TPR) repeat protein
VAAQRGRPREALDDFSRALALVPDHAEAFYQRGLVQAGQGKWQEAIADWSRTISLRPEDDEAHAARGDACCNLNRWDEAARDYAKVVELHPDWPEYLNEAAWVMVAHLDPPSRDARRAVALARRSVELVPDEGKYWNTLGLAQFRAGDWPAAIEALEKSIAFQGRTSFDDFFLAMSRWQLGEQKEALRLYDQAVRWMEKIRPNDQELQRFRAEAAQMMGTGDPSQSKRDRGAF